MFFILLIILVNTFILNFHLLENLWTLRYLNFVAFPEGETGSSVGNTKRGDFDLKTRDLYHLGNFITLEGFRISECSK